MQNNRILRAEEFYQRYKVSPEGLVLWLDQSDVRSYGDVQNWYDLSGKANHAVQATASKQPAITGCQGFAGIARQFDGSDDYMSCGTSSDFNILAAQDFSIVSWFKTTADGKILAKAYSTPYYSLEVVSSKIRLAVRGVGGGETTLPSTTNVNDDKFYMAVGVRDAQNKLYLYLFSTGVEENKNTNDNSIGDLETSHNTIIGSWIGGSNFFIGEIPILMFLRRTLSFAEAQRLYLADAPRFGLL